MFSLNQPRGSTVTVSVPPLENWMAMGAELDDALLADRVLPGSRRVREPEGAGC